MKNILKTLKLSVIALLLTFSACTEKEDSIPNGIFNNVTNGANLRTIKINQSTFNFFDTTSKWSVTVEEQDAQSGALFQEIKIYATKGSGLEKFVKTVPASSFSPGLRGLPTGTITVSLQEALTALGLTTGQYTPSDKIAMRLALVLTDGRVFSSGNSGGQITGGNYFASPHNYSVQFFCPLLSAADFSGNYKVVVDAWADYNVGDTVPVTYSAADGYTFKIQNANNVYITNPTTSYNVTINPATGSVTGTSSAGLDYGLASGALTNVSITGTVGTCTGDINLKLNFTGGYTAPNQTFNLVKL